MQLGSVARIATSEKLCFCRQIRGFVKTRPTNVLFQTCKSNISHELSLSDGNVEIVVHLQMYAFQSRECKDRFLTLANLHSQVLLL